MFLVIAGLLVPALQRFRISPVLGFLVIGLIVGPYGLPMLREQYPILNDILINDVDAVHAVSEAGVIFLLFMIGLELSVERLLAMRKLVFGLGSLQIITTALVIALAASLWDNSTEASIILGLCMALSSTAIVIQLLTEQRRFGSAVGHTSFSILLAQDIAVVPVLFIVAFLGSPSGDSLITSLFMALTQAVLAIAVIFGTGRLIIRPVFRFVGQFNSPEAFLSLTLLVIAVTSLATHAAGLSAALGAFLAGLLLAETEYRHEIEHTIAPFKGMLLGLFFISIGMGINLGEIANNPFWVFASIIGLITLKSAITTLLVKLFNGSWSTAIESGLLLGQGGEFAFVIITLALSLTLIPEPTAQFMLIVVSGTMFLTPLLATFARKIGEAMSKPIEAQTIDMPGDLRGHVVICGYGRIGQLLAQIVEEQTIAHVALEVDAGIAAQCRKDGIPIYQADASRPGIMHQVNIETASAFVITMDDFDAAERVLKTAKQVAPNVPVIMRARDPAHARQLLEDGASQVIPEVMEAGLHMGQVLLESIGFPEEAATGVVASKRDTMTLKMSISED